MKKQNILLTGILMVVMCILMTVTVYASPTAISWAKTANTSNGIKISWSQISEINGYEIRRSVNGGVFTLLTTKGSKTSSFTDKSGIDDTCSYSYKIVPYTGTASNHVCHTNLASETVTRFRNMEGKITANATSTGVKLQWTPMAGADGYKVYYKINSESTMHIINKKGENTTSFVKSGLKDGDILYYYIRAYYLNSEGKECLGAEMETKSYMFLGSMKNLVKCQNNETEIALILTPLNAKEEGYIITYKINNGNYITAKQDKNKNIFTIDGLNDGDTVFYTVTAYYVDDLGNICKGFTMTEQRFKRLSSVQKTIKSTNISSGIKITWTPITGADGYRIYYKINNGESHTINKSGQATDYFTKINLNDGDILEYKIRAYFLKGTTKYLGADMDWVQTVRLGSMEDLLSAENLKNSIKINWKLMPKADGYTVYYRLSDGVTHKINKEVNEDYFTKTNLNNGDVFEYKVRAYYIDENGTKNNGADMPWQQYIKLSTPKITDITYEDEKITISWNKNNIADSYKVYRKLNDGEYQFLSTVNTATLNYTDSDLNLETGERTYSYVVTACNGPSESMISDSYCKTGYLYIERVKCLICQGCGAKFESTDFITGVNAFIAHGEEVHGDSGLYSWIEGKMKKIYFEER